MTLARGEHPSGALSIRADVRGVASGSYIVVVRRNGALVGSALVKVVR